MKSYKTLILGSVATSALMLGAVATPALANNVEVGHKRGTFYLKTKDGKFSALPSAQIQMRYTQKNHDDQDNASDEDTFDLASRRVRFGLKGRAGSKKLTYAVSFDFMSNNGGSEDGDVGSFAIDSYLNYKFSKALQLRAGVWKQRQSEMGNNSSGKLQFVDRPGIRNLVSYRDGGLGVHGNIAKMVTYEVAIIQGASQKQTSSNGAMNNKSYTAHIRVEPFGKFGSPYEGDIKNSKKLKVQIAAAASMRNDVTFSSRGLADKFITAAVEADLYGFDVSGGIKWRGFGLYAEYAQLLMHDALQKGNNKVPGERATAFLVEGSYFILPKKWSVAGRYFRQINNTKAGAGSTTGALNGEVRWGLATSYFFRGQAHKLAFDWTRIIDPDGVSAAHAATGTGGERRTEDDQFRLQWQTRF